MRSVIVPVIPQGTSLGVVFTSAVHGHAEVASIAPRSPLAGKLWPGDVVMLLDGAPTAQMTPDELQTRLADAPDLEHSLFICAEDEEANVDPQVGQLHRTSV